MLFRLKILIGNCFEIVDRGCGSVLTATELSCACIGATRAPTIAAQAYPVAARVVEIVPSALEMPSRACPGSADALEIVLGHALMLPVRWACSHCARKGRYCVRSCNQIRCSKNICSVPRISAPPRFVVHCTRMDMQFCILESVF